MFSPALVLANVMEKLPYFAKMEQRSIYSTNLFYLYDKLSKGVSIVSYQLPYSLKLVKSYPINSNSKAA